MFSLARLVPSRYSRIMIQPKFQIRRKHYTIGLGLLLVGLFVALYLLINQLQSFDTQAVSSLPTEFPSLDGFMLIITTIGSPLAVPLIAFSWAGIELAWKRRDRAFVMLASLLAAPIFYALKEIVHRNRPTSSYANSLGIHSYSFPSGHATMSFAVFMTLAYLISLRVKRRSISRLITTLLLILVIFIGISRVYLGAHYPTDVVGGWIVGSIVLLLIRAYVAAYESKNETRLKV